MLRLSKKVEYALIAMQYIASSNGRVVSAKEIADHYDISFEFLSKALQVLMRRKYVASQQGVAGGYVMASDPHRLTVGEIIEAVDGRQLIVECCGAESASQCTLHRRCPIRTPMAMIQQRIDAVLHSMTIAQLAGESQPFMLSSELSSENIAYQQKTKGYEVVNHSSSVRSAHANGQTAKTSSAA